MPSNETARVHGSTVASDRAIHAPLPELAVAPSMRSTGRWLVQLKNALDELACSGDPLALIPDGVAAWCAPLDSFALVQQIVPFLSMAAGHEKPAHVPIDVVIGESWRWRTTTVDADRQESLTHYLTAPKRARPGDRDQACYFAYPALGIVVAIEGKNRVAFLRDRGATHVPATVTVLDYPAPARIRRFEVDVAGRAEAWAVLDDRWVRRLRHPRWSDVVLTAYDVAAPEPWPAGWPTPVRVASAFDRLDATVDLGPLRASDARAEALVDVAVIQLSRCRVRWRWLSRWALAVVAVGTCGALSGTAGGHGLAYAAMAAVFTGLILLGAPILRVEGGMTR